MISLPATSRNAATAALIDLVDAGGPGRFLIYTADFATLLASAPCSVPAFADPVDGSAHLTAPITGVPVLASGKAAAFRLVDGDGNEVLSGSVGTSGADLVFSSTTWTSGDVIDIADYVHTTPAS